MVVDIFLALEDAVCDISHLRTHGVAYNGLHAVTAECTFSSYGLRQSGNLVVIMGDIGRDIVFEARFGLVAITKAQFYTHVVHCSGIHPLGGAFTHHADTVHQHQNILGLLVEPVERSVECLLEECKVQTGIGLRRGLPFDIIVANLQATETGR